MAKSWWLPPLKKSPGWTRLPIEQRTALVLAEFCDLSHAEIAAIENIELGTVKSRISRARDKLRAQLISHTETK